MAYLTQADYAARFGSGELDGLLDRDRDGSPDAGAFDAAEAAARATVDALIGARYQLPLPDPAPEVIKQAATDLTRYHLHGDRVPEGVRERQQDAMKLLRDIGAGRAVIGGQTEVSHDSGAGMVTSKTTKDRVFTRETLSGY